MNEYEAKRNQERRESENMQLIKFDDAGFNS